MNAKPNAPSCSQIHRACLLVSVGATEHDLHDALSEDLSEYGVYLAWKAAQTAMKEEGLG